MARILRAGQRSCRSRARAASVRLTVHDIAGRPLRRLELGTLAAGRHHAVWDGRGDDGAAVPTGLYLVTFAVDGRPQDTRRVTLLR